MHGGVEWTLGVMIKQHQNIIVIHVENIDILMTDL